MTDDPEERPDSHLSLKELLPSLLLCAFLLGGGLITGVLQEEPDTDEPVYLAMAEAWAKEGRLPYRDFFHAHPPGLLAPYALLFSLAPVSIPLGRILPVLSTWALFLLLIACARRMEIKTGAPGITLFAATLFVVSPLIHLVGATCLGLNLAMALGFLAMWLSLKDHPRIAGWVLGLSLSVRFLTFPLLIVLGVVHRKHPSFFLGALIGVLPLLLCFLLWPGCFDQVVSYHVQKQTMLFPARMAVLSQILYEEKFLLLLAFGALFLPRGKPGHRFLAVGFLCIAFASVQKVVWPYYFHPAVPFLCVGAGVWVAFLLQGRIRGRFLIFPNLALLLGAGLLNIFIISPKYSHDDTLLRLVKKAEVLAGPNGRVLDLSGGGQGLLPRLQNRVEA
ncbi:MAG: hypothetical protein ACYTHM_11930, partial [Planctomycetota bacterium]